MIPILGKAINYRDYTKAQVITHYMPWFGTPGHIKVAYTSADVATCDAHCADMKAKGSSGINLDYYGPDSASALAALHMLGACERAGLTYSLCIDAGAIGALTGDAATQEYIRVLKFASETFLLSPAYLQDAGRYLLTFFGEPTGVDWAKVRAGIKQKIAMVFEGGTGFTHAESDGAFGWVWPLADATNPNMAALKSFNASAVANPTKICFYPIYPGFDDTMAGWSKKRLMSRRLGQTMLDTLAMVPAGAKYVIEATYNDIEEGSATQYSQG